MTDEVVISKVDFKQKVITETWSEKKETGIPKYLRELATLAKRENISGVVVVTIDDQDHVDWFINVKSEHHKALAALILEEIYQDLKDDIFGEGDIGDAP